MQVATGKSILNGIAIGPLRIYKKAEAQTSQTSSLTPAQEWERFETACAKAKEQLAGLYDKALDEVGEDNAAIFEIHQMISNYTPEYRETSGVGKRKLMTMDEVLRMDIDRALVILRGKKVLEVDKYDYSKHPESKKLHPSKAASHIPDWQAEGRKKEKAAPIPAKPKPPRPKAPAKKAPPAKPPAPAKAEPPAPPIPAEPPREPAQEPVSPPPPPPRRSAAKPVQKSGQRVVTATKDSILSKPKKEE